MENTQLDPQELLETILNATKELAEKGKTYAERQLDIPESGEQREQMLDGLKKGALASAVLIGLLGTRGGRSLTGSAIKIGGLAALGTVAYRGYRNWHDNQLQEAAPIYELDGKEAQERGLLLISAMVSAANADGKLDDEESAMLKRQVLGMNLPEHLVREISKITETPLSARELAANVENDETASEIYLATRIFIDDQSSPRELAYLSELIACLDLGDALVAELDRQLA